MKNDMKLTKCATCGTARPKRYVRLPAARCLTRVLWCVRAIGRRAGFQSDRLSYRKLFTEGVKATRWTCKGCTYQNLESKKNCEMCGANAPNMSVPTLVNYTAVLNEIDLYTELIQSAFPLVSEVAAIKTDAHATHAAYNKIAAGCDLSDVLQTRREIVTLQKQMRAKAFNLGYSSPAEKKAAADELQTTRFSGIAQAKSLLHELTVKENYEKDRIVAIGKILATVEARCNELKSSISLAALTSGINGNTAGAASINPSLAPSKVREDDASSGSGSSGSGSLSAYAGTEERELSGWWMDNQALISSARERWRAMIDGGSATPSSGGSGAATAAVSLSSPSSGTVVVDLTNSDAATTATAAAAASVTPTGTPPAPVKRTRANDNKIGSASAAAAASPVASPVAAGVDDSGVDVIRPTDESGVRQVRDILSTLASGVTKIHALLAHAAHIMRTLKQESDRFKTAINQANDVRRSIDQLIRAMTVSDTERANDENERAKAEYYGIRNRIFAESKLLITMKYENEVLTLTQQFSGDTASSRSRAEQLAAAAKAAIAKQTALLTTLYKQQETIDSSIAPALIASWTNEDAVSAPSPMSGPGGAVAQRASSASIDSKDSRKFAYTIPPALRRTGLIVRRKYSDYTLKSVLSKGSCHKVFLVEYEARVCVLKQIPITDMATALVFENEILCREAVKHPLVSEIEAAFVDSDGNGYLQFKYHALGTLLGWSSTNPKPFEYQSVFQQLFEIVAFLHARNLTHGNLSPGNIMMTTNPNGTVSPILIDFGLAKLRLPATNVTINQFITAATTPTAADAKSAPFSAASATGSGSSIGNKKPVQSDSAPEVVSAKSNSDGGATPASDMWSLAIIMFRLTWKTLEPVVDVASGSLQVPSHESTDRLRDLILSIGATDPKKRATASECLVGASYFVVSYASDLYETRSVVDSKTKINLFAQHIEKIPRLNTEVKIKLKRTNLVNELLPKLDEMNRSTLLSRFKVEYTDFKGQDDGGLTADLFTEFFIRICDGPSAGHHSAPSGSGAATAAASAAPHHPVLFVGVALEDAPRSGVTYLPNGEHMNTRHYVSIGKMFCKGLIDGRPLPTRFAPSLFKYLLNIKPNLKDLEMFDRTQALALKKILTLPDVESLSLDFGELKSGGSRVAVTDENKAEYVRLKVEHVLVSSRIKQLAAIKLGFATAIEQGEHISRLSCADLMSFMCGEENLTAESILCHIKFSGFGSSPTPEHFLQYLSELFPTDLKRFLRLATSQYNLPRGGGLARKITIQATQDTSKLPVGHTCSYQVDLPDYQNYELLKEKMMLALAYIDSCGFDYV